MRIAILLSPMMLIAACGHMAPYSEHRGAHVEMYNVAGAVYLRVPYRVMVYDLIPRTYLDEEWIAPGTSSSGHKLLTCSPTQRAIYGEPIPMNGVVDITAAEVRLNLVFPPVAGRSDQARPYKFNGTWPLVKMKGTPPASPNHRQFGCE